MLSFGELGPTRNNFLKEGHVQKLEVLDAERSEMLKASISYEIVRDVPFPAD